jgi:PqqD family protein of HPr-rel-A system
VTRPDDLHVRQLDGQPIIYDAASGDTHCLMPPAIIALRALSDRALSADKLSEAVAAALDLPLDDEVRQVTVRLVDQLDRVGLIEPVDAPEQPDSSAAS